MHITPRFGFRRVLPVAILTLIIATPSFACAPGDPICSTGKSTVTTKSVPKTANSKPPTLPTNSVGKSAAGSASETGAESKKH